MRIINEIIECEVGYLTIHEKRARILAYIRGKGVAFKDVKNFLEKEAISLNPLWSGLLGRLCFKILSLVNGTSLNPLWSGLLGRRKRKYCSG